MQQQRVQGIGLFVGLSVGLSLLVVLVSILLTQAQEAALMDPCDAINYSTSPAASDAYVNNAYAMRDGICPRSTMLTLRLVW